NNLQELREIWAQWDDEVRQLFYHNYGDLPYLLDIKVDEHLFRALAQFWNSAYSCFTFGEVDMVPTVEEYTALLRCPRIQVDKVYARTANVLTFTKKLAKITGMSQILAHPDAKKKVDVLALSIYGLVIFPKALGHIDETVTDLFNQLDRGITSVPVILAKTFRSLSAYRRAELVATPRHDDITGEKWMAILQNLQDEDVEWKAPWIVPDEILYRCGDFDWVPLLRI
ncbi:hypothetical protein Gotur_025638, partial [Gossypium turneri]